MRNAIGIACVIVAWAFQHYREGKGGFRLGVDLVGGTILVYQVDPAKPHSANVDELYLRPNYVSPPADAVA